MVNFTYFVKYLKLCFTINFRKIAVFSVNSAILTFFVKLARSLHIGGDKLTAFNGMCI
jgi:hypothetical protein